MRPTAFLACVFAALMWGGLSWSLWQSPFESFGMLLLAALGFFTGFMPRPIESLLSIAFRAPTELSWWYKGGLPVRAWNYHKIQDGIYIGRVPRTDEDASELKQKGIGAVLAVMEDWELCLDPMSWIAGDMSYKQLAVPDFCPPSMDQLAEGVQFLQEMIKEKRTVFVHCNGGKGRSVSVVLAYLMSTKAIDVEKALALVSAIRPVAKFKTLFGLKSQWQRLIEYDQQAHRQRHMAAIAKKAS
mmetsp:Transcript_10903/g.12357  ORF Transcript_10903/g.12357 Transcript_10903/m.12357 type:complete len:243 (+) Transcript_10903:33-761(+)